MSVKLLTKHHLEFLSLKGGWPGLSESTLFKMPGVGNLMSRLNYNDQQGAQWLSGRVLDSKPKGSGFEPHRRHCVVVLEQDTFILA